MAKLLKFFRAIMTHCYDVMPQWQKDLGAFSGEQLTGPVYEECIEQNKGEHRFSALYMMKFVQLIRPSMETVLLHSKSRNINTTLRSASFDILRFRKAFRNTISEEIKNYNP
jgi:hypothetical protein